MSNSQIAPLRGYLQTLLYGFNALQTEKQALQAAATRLPAINAEMQDLVADAQAALDKLNALQGTTFTLQEMRQQLGAIAP
jgi:hypothetical protein